MASCIVSQCDARGAAPKSTVAEGTAERRQLQKETASLPALPLLARSKTLTTLAGTCLSVCRRNVSGRLFQLVCWCWYSWERTELSGVELE